NDILVGGIDVWHWRLYTDLNSPSGQWTRLSEWAASPYSYTYVHADQHEMEWDKEGNLYMGNDGGIFTYTPPFPNDVQYMKFKHLVKNYNVTQFYAMSAGPDGSMAGGTQDNGTQLNNHTGFTHQTNYKILGGDGFATEISQLDPNGIVSSVYFTSLVRSDDGGGNQSSVATPCTNCGSFVTKFTLQEIERDGDTEDFVNYIFSADTIIKADSTYNFEYASENFRITLYGSYTNTTGADVTFNRNDVLPVKDSVQALFAVSIEQNGRGVYVTRDIWKYGQSPQWWRVTGTELGFAGTNVSALKFSKNGKHLFLGTSDGDVWRVDGIGDAYTRGEGDLANAFNTVSADGGKFGIIDKISAPIIGVDQTNEIFTLSGDHTAKILVGRKVKVDGSSGNNRIYTVSAVNLNGTDTEVTVTTAIPSATASGQMNVYFSAPFTYPTIDFYNNTYYDAVNINNITNFKLNLIKIHDGSGYVTDIAVDPNDENHALITYGRFGTNRIYESATAATTTTTTSFSSISAGLASMPVYCAVIDKDDSNKIFAGTTFGLWYTEDGGVTWQENNEKFGRVPVYEIRQDVNKSNEGTQFDGAIYIATHGRGMWSTNIFLLKTDELAPEDKQKFKSGISLYPNPANDVINVAYDLLGSSEVTVNIVTIDGKISKSIALGSKHAGRHRNNINIEDLPNGMYLLQLKTASDSKVAKFIKF
ncbi:MAG: T9SS type A sorting domain-containing protein, partial [Bacteroidia bacterium]